MNIIYTKKCLLHVLNCSTRNFHFLWLLGAAVMQNNPAKDYFGFCTGANKPHLGIMLYGYFESLSGSNAKDTSGWKPD